MTTDLQQIVASIAREIRQSLGRGATVATRASGLVDWEREFNATPPAAQGEG